MSRFPAPWEPANILGRALWEAPGAPKHGGAGAAGAVAHPPPN